MAENPFSICFNMLKLKYATYDASISSLNILNPEDKVNIFLSVETILKYLTSLTELEKKLFLNRDFKISMTSDLINVAAHYKEFFKNNGLDTKVFLYMTDLESEEEEFPQCEYNIDYRCYYINKYTGNPKFVELTEAFNDFIIPKTQVLCNFIPDVYFIKSKNIEGSLIPYIVSEKYPDRKNFIVSGDIYDTQYNFVDNFVCHLFKRHYSNSTLSCTVPDYLKIITHKDEVSKEETEIYSNKGFYTLLLASIGEKYRSINKIMGIGSKTLCKNILLALNESKITKETESIELLSTLFEDIGRDEIIENYNTISLDNSIGLLTDGDKKILLDQIVDRSDLNSLMKLNNEIFGEYPLRIESLLG